LKIKDEAATWRQAIRDAYKRDYPDSAEALEDLAQNEAEKIEHKHGFENAKAFYDAAPPVEPTLTEAAKDRA
jgi:collagenase-like PrtC family protease